MSNKKYPISKWNAESRESGNIQCPSRIRGIPPGGRISNIQVEQPSGQAATEHRLHVTASSHPLRESALHRTAVTLTETRRHGVTAGLNRCGEFRLAAISHPAFGFISCKFVSFVVENALFFSCIDLTSSCPSISSW
jgi:hypothetical protein